MSESATGRSPSKHTRRSKDRVSAPVISGFAANSSAGGGGSATNSSAIVGGSTTSPDAAGDTNQVGIISSLKAALVLKVTFIKLLPITSRLFFTPLAESVLCESACLFYAEEKARETKSNPNYVSNSAKKLGIVLQAMPEVQEGQGFETLRSDLAKDLEKFCAHITKEYVLKSRPKGQDTIFPSAR
jgi:hypothetical protein